MYLGCDLGTTNVKALLVDDNGRVVASGTAPVERLLTPDGGVEQDIEQIWDATCTAISQAAEGNGNAIRAIGVSSQGGALQLVDNQDRPLGRVISWLDCRGLPFDRALTARLGPDFLAEHIGFGRSTMTHGQVLRLRRDAPQMLRLPNRLGFVGDVIVGRLCGRRAHDATSLGIAMLYNPWLRKADPDILTHLGLEEAQLPDLLSPTSPAGPLLPEAAQRMGLQPGIPVSPAVHDQYAAALGAGSVAPGEINFGAGTAWVLLANTEQLVRPVTDKAFVCSHLVPNVYGQMLSLVNGGSTIQWATRLLGEAEASITRVDELVDSAPAGSDGLRFWPFLCPRAEADLPDGYGGRLDRVALTHEPRHLMRAVVEGLVLELARHLDSFARAGLVAHRLSMCGTAAASRTTPQIVADITNLPVACIDVPDVSTFGAAMIACALTADRQNLADLARRWRPAGHIVHPGRNTALYHKLLEDYLAAFCLNPAHT